LSYFPPTRDQSKTKKVGGAMRNGACRRESPQFYFFIFYLENGVELFRSLRD
jgi:hypothetical protein